MAIQVVAGEPLSTYVTYRFPDETPILGATFTIVEAIMADGESFADRVTWEEHGSGVYTFTAPTYRGDPAGTWYLLVEASEDRSQFQEAFDVTATRPTVQVVQPMFRGGTSRLELRRMVAQELGDLVLVTATAEGTQSTVVDDVSLTLEDRHYNGMSIRCTAGAPENVGRIGQVTVSSQYNRSINFIPPFPVNTMEGDEFELTNRRGTGWRAQDYDNAINAAIRKAGDEHYSIPYTVDSGIYQGFGQEILIPEEMRWFSGVAYQDRRGDWRQVPPSMVQVNRFARTVSLGRGMHTKARTRLIRLYGEIEPPLLEQDDHRTLIPTDWLVSEVKAILQNANVSVSMNQSNRDRLFYMDRQGADARRTLIIPARAPNTIKLY